MVQAAVLIKASARDIVRITGAFKKVKGVLDAFPVFGRFDAVAVIRADDYKTLQRTAAKLKTIRGVKSTETLAEAR